MKLENEVINLKLAKQLDSLGFEQKSLFYYDVIDDNAYTINFCAYSSPGLKRYSAFATSELMEIIPHWIDTKSQEPFNNFRFNLDIKIIFINEKYTKYYCVNYYCDTYQPNENGVLSDTLKLFPHVIYDSNLPNSLAKTIVYLIDKGLMEIDLQRKTINDTF